MFRSFIALVLTVFTLVASASLNNLRPNNIQRRVPSPDSEESSGSWSTSAGIETIKVDYYSLASQIESCRSSLSSDQVSVEIVTERLKQLASHFQIVLGGFQDCQKCHDRVINLQPVFHNVFTQFYLLISTFKQRFQSKWSSIFADCFGGFDQNFIQFLQICQSKGLSLNQVVPSGLGTVFKECGLTASGSLLFQVGIL